VREKDLREYSFLNGERKSMFAFFSNKRADEKTRQSVAFYLALLSLSLIEFREEVYTQRGAFVMLIEFSC